MDEQDLVDAALAVRQNAYAKYSSYRVGSALLDDRGKLFAGCNVENAAYPEGTCAEANAIAAMIADGGKSIQTIVIAGEVSGNANAAERVEIAPSGRLTGNIAAPRITIADGAHFKGSVDMERGAEKRSAKSDRADEIRRIPEVKEDLPLKGQPRA